jgi:hypothetical protein
LGNSSVAGTFEKRRIEAQSFCLQTRQRRRTKENIDRQDATSRPALADEESARQNSLLAVPDAMWCGGGILQPATGVQ